MKKWIPAILLMAIVLIAGCSKSLVHNSHPAANHTKNEPVKLLTERPIQAEPISYRSITDYQEMVGGPDLKTGKLRTQLKGDILFLDMDFVLTPKLKEVMLHTKNKFYFSFSDISGDNKIKRVVTEQPALIEGKLEDMAVESGKLRYHLSQKVKIKKHPSAAGRKIVQSPANYQLSILDEKKELAAAVIGLEVSSIY